MENDIWGWTIIPQLQVGGTPDILFLCVRITYNFRFPGSISEGVAERGMDLKLC